MPKNHPLYNYYALLEDEGIKNIHNTFFNKEIFIDAYKNLYEDEFCKLQVSWSKNFIGYEIDFDYSNKEPHHLELSFDKYLSDILNGYFLLFKRTVRNELLRYSDEPKNKVYTSNLQKELFILTSYIKNIPVECWGPITNNLNLLDSFLSAYSNVVVFQQNINVKDSQVASNPKIKWLGKIKTLPTLFYDLLSGENNLDQILIDVTKQNLVDFIINNFVEKNGQALSKATISTCLQETRSEKRDKNNILIREDRGQEIPQAKKVRLKRYKDSKQVLSSVKAPIPKGKKLID